MSGTWRLGLSPKQTGVKRRGITWAGLLSGVLMVVSGCALNPSPAGQGVTNGAKLVVPTHVASEFAASPSLTSQWLQSHTQQQSVTLRVSLTANQLALNGYSHGFAEVDVPVGWHVTIQFKNNNSVLPGGLMVVKPADVISPKRATPAMLGAGMKQPYQGIGLHQSATFSFVAANPGAYVLESAPSAVSGTWVWFVVKSGLNAPLVLLKHAKP